MFAKFWSLMKYKGNPLYIPLNLLKKFYIKWKIKYTPINELTLALTFDVENSPFENYNLNDFFSVMGQFLRERKIELTFFLQANLISEHVKQLHKFRGRVEFGLHSFAHELWGNERWWLNKKPLSVEEKEKLLKLSLKSFTENHLKRPFSFRAPYLLVNKSTFHLIKSFGFTVDSSLPSFEGVPPIPQMISGVMSIPLSADPIPRFHIKYIIPCSYYRTFNITTLKSLNTQELLQFINTVTSFQLALGYPPHLVFLGHSWEFSSTSDEAYIQLNRICSILEEKYKINYLTMQRLAKWLRRCLNWE